MTLASAAQIGAIHALSKRLGMTEDERRDFMARASGGKRSSAQLSSGEAITVINGLKDMQGGAPAPKAASELDGKYAPLLRALWLSGWSLGVVREKSDKALLAFLERQTGLSHTRFLREAGAARRVIEALKGWLAREAGVAWPGDGDVWASKAAVYDAQTRRLIASGFPLADQPAGRDMTGAELDAEIRARGAALRKALKAPLKEASNG